MYNIPVFLSSDNNYAPLVATTIASICDNTNSNIDFYILDGGISDENKKHINELKNKFNNFSIKYIKIDTDKIFEGVEAKNNITRSAFNRLLIPQLIPEIDKAIYLDVDIIALGDIYELYNEDLNGYIIGAVPDQGKKSHIENVKKVLEIPEGNTYFNSGVLLIDCCKWRKFVKLKDLLDVEEKYRDVRKHNDQDVLNKYFTGNYKQLPFKYNVIYDNEEIIIRHFAGSIKPWHLLPYTKTDLLPNINLFWHYAKLSLFYKTFLNMTPKNKKEQNLLLRQLQIYKIIREA